MYIKIKDNFLIDWADWEFEGSTFVDIDYDYFNEHQDQYLVVEGVLTDISKTQEFMAKELADAKALKLVENVQKRDERLRAGVEFKGVMFDSDTDSKVNIMGAVATLPDDAVVGWNSMDNQTVNLTKQELAELGGLLVTLTSAIWGENGLNVQFINAINACKTIEELAAIEIDYSLGIK